MSERLPDKHEQKQPRKKLIPFFPDYLLDEVIAWYVALALLVALASLIPAGLEEQANPLNTPEHVKPEWYFLFFYQFLKLVPRSTGILVMGASVLILLLVPFLDRGSRRAGQRRRIPIVVGLAIIVVIVVLTVWGVVS